MRQCLSAAATAVLLTLLICTGCAGKKRADNTLRNLSSDNYIILMQQADSLYDQNPDSALLLYTIIANRFDDRLPEREKKAALRAALSRWELIFFNHFDYTSAFDALNHAEAIAENLGITEPRIALYTGHMYHTAYEQTLAGEPGQMALDSFRKALRQGTEQDDWVGVRMAFGNIVELAHSLGRMDSIDEEAEIYRQAAQKHNDSNESDFDLGYYRVLKLLAEGEEERSIAILDSIAPLLPASHTRYHCAIGLTKAEALSKSGRHEEAMAALDSVERLAMSGNMRDGKLTFYSLKADVLDNMGRHKEADSLRTRQTMLKDSLLNYQQVEQLSRHKFIARINDMERNITAMREQRRRHILIIAIISLAAVAVGGCLWMLCIKNRNLRMANETLYRKTVEMLRSKEEARRCDTPTHETGKYRGSTLSDITKEELWGAVRDALDGSDEIFNPDFSISRLCELCGSKEKYVSQVINEHGENFSTMLNNRRIDEACRRIEGHSEYRHLTLEAIGNSVGFKSPNAFRSNFKRRTGLTPSQYQAQARNNRK